MIKGLEKLEDFNCTNNKIVEMPNTISNLVSLKKLTMNFNQLSFFPDISNIPNIRWIDLGANQFNEFPLSLTQNDQLCVLNLYGNNIKEIPSSISNLTNLVTLYLGCNKLTSLPEEIASMTNLTELFFCGNKFIDIPYTLLSLTRVTELSFSNNKLTKIPDNISKLAALKRLHLDVNKITVIPPSIGELTSLLELNLAHNEIEELPIEFASLVNIVDLDLSGNAISDFPLSVEHGLSQLQQLKISFNRLIRLPKFMNKEVPSWVSFSGNTSFRMFYNENVGIDKIYSWGERTINKKKNRKEYYSSFNETSHSANKFDVSISSGEESSENGMSKSVRIKMKSTPPSTTKEEALSYRSTVGWSEMCGRRPDMQDTIVIVPKYRGNSDRYLLCAFDGHAGEKSAQLASNTLPGLLALKLDTIENEYMIEKKSKKSKKNDEYSLGRRGSY